MELAPSREEVRAFLERFVAALASPDAVEEATADASRPGGMAFGMDVGALREAAWRRALPAGSEMPLRVLARWQVPRFLEQLAAAVLDPRQRLRQLRQHVVAAAAKVARAKSAAWTAEHARDLYGVLNEALTELGLGAGLAEALLAIEERGAAPAAEAAEDAIVLCPMTGQGASVRFGCGRCSWRGVSAATCLLPAARAFAVAADAIGRGRGLPEALRGLLAM